MFGCRLYLIILRAFLCPDKFHFFLCACLDLLVFELCLQCRDIMRPIMSCCVILRYFVHIRPHAYRATVGCMASWRCVLSLPLPISCSPCVSACRRNPVLSEKRFRHLRRAAACQRLFSLSPVRHHGFQRRDHVSVAILVQTASSRPMKYPFISFPCVACLRVRHCRDAGNRWQLPPDHSALASPFAFTEYFAVLPLKPFWC